MPRIGVLSSATHEHGAVPEGRPPPKGQHAALALALLGIWGAASAAGCRPPGTQPNPVPQTQGPKLRAALEGYSSYDETGDGRQQLDAALSRARSQGKHVLAMFGGNWCVWCRALDRLFSRDDEIAQALSNGFVLVHLDSGTNDQLNQEFGDPFRHGFPVLVVVSEGGKPLHTQETGSLEAADKSVAHDRDKVLDFLKAWIPPSARCPPGQFFVHGGCHTPDGVGVAGPAAQ
ncbi:MAG: thioredoxin family protein [Myxococcota bacterium]